MFYYAFKMIGPAFGGRCLLCSGRKPLGAWWPWSNWVFQRVSQRTVCLPTTENKIRTKCSQQCFLLNDGIDVVKKNLKMETIWFDSFLKTQSSAGLNKFLYQVFVRNIYS